MITFKCYLDGKEITDQNLIRALNQNEISVFESLRLYNGTVFRFNEHLKRFAESARSCGIDLPAIPVLIAAVQKALKAHGGADGFIRITFHAEKIFVMIGERKHNPAIYKTGVDLKTSSFRMPSPGETDVQAKTGNYRLQLLAGKPEGAYEWLFLDESHFVTEARVGNFFMVKKGSILTPPAVSVLNGITREVVIECARDLGLFVRETPLTRHEAFNADEAFLTNTSWEILPVRSLDGRLIQAPVPGPITLKLINCFHRKVNITCRPPKKVSEIRKSNARSSPSRIKKD
ncbi:MAG TPA: aminotransferase class IV [Candidatus Omnitrophota bacterium]|nr:hypothetical protein [Candidatus Omnitrophota bacterium]HRK62228.1 aminotransferase class IV [Candidatus Omnitrophota bacterium]